MFLNPCALFVLALISSGQAQSSTSSYVQPTVPTGTPVPGNYTGALRPQIHFSPPQWFMVSEISVISRFVRLARFTPKQGCVLCLIIQRDPKGFDKAETDCLDGQVLNCIVLRMTRTVCLLMATEFIIFIINVCRG